MLLVGKCFLWGGIQVTWMLDGYIESERIKFEDIEIEIPWFGWPTPLAAVLVSFQFQKIIIACQFGDMLFSINCGGRVVWFLFCIHSFNGCGILAGIIFLIGSIFSLFCSLVTALDLWSLFNLDLISWKFRIKN